MGMAASQARYLSLVARKSNCEYEGQQINQSRLVLSNQSAELFNQMLALEIPTPPSKSNFTYNQYSFKIGEKVYTIDKWNQLAQANSDGYNYVVTYHYESKEYTGYQKFKIDPQVQFSGNIPTSATSYSQQISVIEDALKRIDACKEDYEKAENEYKTLLAQAGNLTFYRDTSFNGLTKSSITPLENPDGSIKGYRVTGNQTNEDGYQVFSYMPSTGIAELRYLKSGIYYYKDMDNKYQPVSPEEDPTEYVAMTETRDYLNYEYIGNDKSTVKTAVNTLEEFKALDEGYPLENMYYDSTTKTMVFLADLKNVGDGTTSILNTYYPTYSGTDENIHGISNVKNDVDTAKNKMQAAKSALDIAEATYDALDVPTYVGNYALTPLSTLSDEQVAAIDQIMKNMKDEDIETNIIKCFNTLDGTYNASTYIGGIYAFDQGNNTFYTTYYDLANSIVNGSGINNIDNQEKLPYYGAETMDIPKTETQKAILETDASGRFTSIRFENDSVVYPLNAETATDEIAYDDAMNEYNYEKAIYDKKVQDINAKTSLIHKQDQNLELRLKQLDTEQNALNTEIDAVAKVVKDNIEKSFKTFGG